MNRFASIIWGVILLAFLASSSPLGPSRNFKGARDGRAPSPRHGDIRLPRHVLPTHYEIQLLPFIEEGNFTTHGDIKIYVHCEEEANNITMNMADITLDNSTVTVEEIHAGGNQMVNIQEVVDDSPHERLTIIIDGLLVPGSQYVISMKFVSYLNEELRGFYRSSYVEDGVTKYLAVSQMESTDARRAFPCFDEPNMKAQFTITLGRKESMTSSSNMPLKETTPIDGMPGYEWDHYETSLKMSSYLVALMVSDFIKIPSDPTLSNVEFNIWSRTIVQNQTEYARQKGPEVLEFYESYFEIEFPLPKEDMAAIPDFGPGAMENWGLVTYREELVLFDETKSSAADKQLILEVIAHELAHQWFGNLVTIDWWNVIWLNEGFARYMQYLGADAVEPTFQMNDQYVLEVLHKVFGDDALESSRPLSVEVNTQEEIDQAFDSISYNKGASIIRMLANFLGHETFRKGLTNYLRDNAYDNAVQDDLWNALEKQAANDEIILPATVKEIMDSWTLKKNYPVVTIIRDYGESDGATAIQERFLLRTAGNSSDDSTVYQWWIPLTHTADFNGNSATVWISMNEKEQKLTSLAATNEEWVIFNVDQVGFYRVKYDETNYGLILKQLTTDHTKIGTANRAQLMEDSLTIARAGLLPYAQALDLTTYLAKEQDYVPWHASLTALTYLDNMLYSSDAYNNWASYMRSLIDPLYDFVHFDEDDSDSLFLTYTRVDALDWACKLGNADCIKKASDSYSEWMTDPSKELSPNKKKSITCTAIRNGGEDEWTFAYDAYLASVVTTEQAALLSAMGCSKDPATLLRMLEMMISPTSGIRLQNGLSVFEAVSGNPDGSRIAFEFLRDRFNDIRDYFYGYISMGTFFKTVSLNFNTESQLNEMMELRDDHPDELAGSALVDQAFEIIQGNIEWMEKHYEEVANWLEDNTPTSTAPTTTKTTTSTTESPNGSHRTQNPSTFYYVSLLIFAFSWAFLSN